MNKRFVHRLTFLLTDSVEGRARDLGAHQAMPLGDKGLRRAAASYRVHSMGSTCTCPHPHLPGGQYRQPQEITCLKHL